MRDPFLEQLLFDLTVREAVREITNEAKGKLHNGVGSFLIS